MISDKGDVTNKKSGRVLKQKTTKSGYKSVCLYLASGKKMKYIHRLVGLEFIDNPKNMPEINHINGIKSDNRVENLEWCSSSENQKHAFDTGLQKGTVLRGWDHGKYKGEIIAKSIVDAKEIIIRSVADSKKHGFNPGHVSSCLTGKLHHHKKHIFIRIKYA